MEHTVVLGNGISGITTARNLRKHSNEKITIVSGETEYFFSRTALMYIFMGHMRFEDTMPYEPSFWPKNKLDLKQGWVESIDFANSKLQFADGSQLSYTKLVLALGSTPNKFGWPGQDLQGVQGLYSYQDLQNLEHHFKKGMQNAVIVGGGLIGVELAEMLHSRGVHVHFLVREDHFWGSVLPPQDSELVGREILKNGIDLRFNSNLESIVDNGKGEVKAVRIKESDEEITCDFVGLTAGVRPNVDWLKDTELNIDRGIVVNEYLETNIPNVYACGDCAQIAEPLDGRKPIEAVWYAGRMMGNALGLTLSGKRTAYQPGPWFNSAKFFDLEYQTYGTVLASIPEHQQSFYWENGEGTCALHLVFDKENSTLIGVNAFGIRLRHEMMDHWLREGLRIEQFFLNWNKVVFDPEFYTNHQPHIVQAFNTQFGTEIPVKKKGFSLFKKGKK